MIRLRELRPNIEVTLVFKYCMIWLLINKKINKISLIRKFLKVYNFWLLWHDPLAQIARYLPLWVEILNK